MNEHELDLAVKICLRETLSDNCAVFKSGDASCTKIKRYITSCPDAKPRRLKHAKPVIDKPIKHEPATKASTIEESSNQGITEISADRATQSPAAAVTTEEMITEKQSEIAATRKPADT